MWNDLIHRLRLTSVQSFRSKVVLVARLSSRQNNESRRRINEKDDEIVIKDNENEEKNKESKPSSKLMKDLANAKQSYDHVTSSELMRRCITFTLCRSSVFAKHALWMFTDGRKMIGPLLFDLFARPLCFSLFVGGEDKEQLEQSFHHCLNNNLVPFPSPMLEALITEDNEDDFVSKKQNVEKIVSCIHFYNEHFQHLQMKPLAIKPSAILSLANLEKMSKWLANREVDSQLLDSVAIVMGLKETDNNNNSNDIENNVSSLKQVLSKDFEKECQNLIDICTRSSSSSITLFIDAEHSWLQPSVRVLTLALMSHFNIEKTVIANTYQCYLTSSLSEITNDLDLALKNGFNLGCKIVRGAYMHLERERSTKFGLKSPIFDSYLATTENYDQVMNFVLDQKVKFGTTNLVLVATHNSDSVMAAVDKMHELDMECNACNVHFGQQRAMADPLAKALVNNGYKCWKLMPIGTMDELLAWLARRVQENFDALKRTSQETRLIRAELRRRFINAVKGKH